MNRLKTLRPHAIIRKTERRGYAYIPVNLQEELGIKEDEKAEIPVYVNANVLLLIRKNAKKQDVLRGLKILAEDIDLRWQEGEEEK